MVRRTRYDVVIVGGGHNGLVAAAYLARAGKTVLVLEQRGRLGGAAVSARMFDGVDARVSRYSYLVSLLPARIVRELGLRFETRRRRISSYTPVGEGGLLIDTESQARTRDSFVRLTGSDREFESWQRFYELTAGVARQVFPTLTEPLPTRAELRQRVGAAAWDALFERPLGETLETYFSDDIVRGVVFTDALIGTFTHAHDASLKQNRCFLYHVIGGGTGDWDVPVGGMGALTDALTAAARAAGAELVTGCRVTDIDTDGARAEVRFETGAVGAGHVLVNAAPHELQRLLGQAGEPKPEGAQVKVNMVLRRLPRLRDSDIDPRDAFAGTFHVAESYAQLERSYREAASGRMPSQPPSEIYCHTLTDPTILGRGAETVHTLTLFGLHTPARLFHHDPEGARAAILAATLDRLDAVLAEPIRDCLAADAHGAPCLEVRTPLDLERDIGLPGGHIFHRDLSFPYRDNPADAPAERWGVAAGPRNVYLCGAGAVRGGGVSGIGGHNAAMAVLEATSG
ncbi:phytoene desaturase family protein [Nocardia donostiensis]|uniref:Pyridine nucleotide-disulfide oxidoreductase domain-containing protein 2 n=1 Tax=Nocardia donostiensis TaxID=1538463 RepID=A0A1V2THH2_9NOCA|nr:NAD(P)/FAD-dependent oxidoreductase [Nocardia donostiensis]ONM48908.1 FAD-dependent oxidoreductase [Nocardia donostiensis]OQS15472.1 FAD-dependent oxidoreductase [Nocardia donostiensis]OQS22836.1 FAD-dependent oxidoreductase [Nocardia donostiensis]